MICSTLCCGDPGEVDETMHAGKTISGLKTTTTHDEYGFFCVFPEHARAHVRRTCKTVEQHVASETGD
jgi:hypothetical protein